MACKIKSFYCIIILISQRRNKAFKNFTDQKVSKLPARATKNNNPFLTDSNSLNFKNESS